MMEHGHRHSHSHGHTHGGIDIGHHDWHSTGYVTEWIDKDVTRDDERRPVIREMLGLTPFPRNGALRVLDVGGGYGVVTDEVLKTFPNAQVTLQDYSEPMFEQARKRLQAHGGRVEYAQRDFSKPGWADGLGGPFDMAVSGIAIHNLGAEELIRQVYNSVRGLLKPGGVFLDLDYVGRFGAEKHVEWLRAAGFAEAKCARLDGGRAMLVASTAP